MLADLLWARASSDGFCEGAVRWSVAVLWEHYAGCQHDGGGQYTISSPSIDSLFENSRFDTCARLWQEFLRGNGAAFRVFISRRFRLNPGTSISPHTFAMVRLVFVWRCNTQRVNISIGCVSRLHSSRAFLYRTKKRCSWAYSRKRVWHISCPWPPHNVRH